MDFAHRSETRRIDAMKAQKAIYLYDHISVKEGKFVTTQEKWPVILMATVGIYSMVRRSGCSPFVVDTRKLIFPTPAPSAPKIMDKDGDQP